MAINSVEEWRKQANRKFQERSGGSSGSTVKRSPGGSGSGGGNSRTTTFSGNVQAGREYTPGGGGGNSFQQTPNSVLSGGAYDPPDNGGFSPENAGETIDQAYGNFFNRQADQAGRDYWAEQLNSGAFDSRGDFREAFLSGAQANQAGGTYNAKSGQWEGTTDDQRRFMNDQFYDRGVERPMYADVTQNWATGRVNEGQSAGDSSIERAFNLQFYRDPTEAGFDRFSDQTGNKADLNAAVLSGAQGDDRQIARDRYQRNDRGDDYEDPFAGGQSVADTFAAYADNPDGQFYTDEQLGNVAQTANRAQFYGDGKFAESDGTLYEYPEGMGPGDANMFSRDGFEEMLAQLPEGQKRSLAAAFGQYSTRTPEVSQALESGTYNVRRS